MRQIDVSETPSVKIVSQRRVEVFSSAQSVMAYVGAAAFFGMNPWTAGSSFWVRQIGFTAGALAWHLYRRWSAARTAV